MPDAIADHLTGPVVSGAPLAGFTGRWRIGRGLTSPPL
jgi:hypothetical protein